MKITLKAAVLYTLLKNETSRAFFEAKLGSWDVREYRENRRDREDKQDFDLVYWSKKEIISLRDYLKAVPEVLPQTVQSIERWLEALNNPNNAEVTSLQQMEKIFRLIYPTLPNRWLMKKYNDGTTNPIAVTGFKYEPGRRDSSAYFMIKYRHGLYYKEDEDEAANHHTEEGTEYFHHADLKRENNTADEETPEDEWYLGAQEYDEDEDGVSAKKKAISRQLKKGDAKLITEILGENGLSLITEDEVKEYITIQKKFLEVAKRTGALYTNSEYGYTSSRWSRSRVTLQEDGVLNKLVVDVGNISGVPRSTEGADSNKGQIPLPYHPYVKMYDITKHRVVICHLTLLQEYKYNTNIVTELVLPLSKKQMLNNLVEGTAESRDVITGKGGGIIVLCSGKAGTGKTLTAEIYSEVLKKPLYQIQSAQLGLDIDTIEKNLNLVLKRAARWNAVLLIDECDTYVYERGNNMLQNCIVGTFLRLLEYFNGVLFMTTNRSDIIDAAIMSRVTAHVRFETPELPEKLMICSLLCQRYGIGFEEDTAMDIFDSYPQMTGRDIRNLCKLVKKFWHGKKQITMSPETMKPLLDYIPFLNSKQINQVENYLEKK